MRNLLIIALLTSLISPALAKNARRPSNNSAKKIYTFACRAEDAEEDSIVGVVDASMQASDAGQAHAILYTKRGRTIENKPFSAGFSPLPEGFTLVVDASVFGKETNFIVPNKEGLAVSGLPKQFCNVTSQLESK